MREHKGTAAEFSTVQAAVFTHLAATPLYVTLEQWSRFRQVSEELLQFKMKRNVPYAKICVGIFQK